MYRFKLTKKYLFLPLLVLGLSTGSADFTFAKEADFSDTESSTDSISYNDTSLYSRDYLSPADEVCEVFASDIDNSGEESSSDSGGSSGDLGYDEASTEESIPEITTGWVKKNGKKYYYNKDGSTAFGRKTIKGKKYLFHKKGYKMSEKDITQQLGKASGKSRVKGYGGYSPSAKTRKKLNQAISSAKSGGYGLGFIMLDPVTGKGISYNCDKAFWSASSIKGLYITSVVYNKPSALSNDHYSISEILHKSNNQLYWQLRYKYGNSPMRKWCKKAGVSSSYGNSVYPYYSARTLAKLWAPTMMYFDSGKTGNKLGKMFESPNVSTIHKTLGKKYTTRTKAGWTISWRNNATSDGGVVYKGKKGNRPMLVAIVSNIPGNHRRLNALTSAINRAHNEIIKED